MANRAAQLRATHPLPLLRRGKRFLEFDLGGGQRRFVTTIEPLHYGAALDQEIDTAWQPDAGVWQHQMIRADFEARAKTLFNGAPLVEYRTPGADTISLQPGQLEYTNDRNDVQLIASPQAVAASVADDVLTWNDGYGAGRTFRWQAHPSKLLKQLLLQSAAALPPPTSQILGGAAPVLRLQFTFIWSASLTPFVNGVVWGTTGGNSPTTIVRQPVEFRLSDGRIAGEFLLPLVIDAAFDVPLVVTRVRRQGANLLIEVRVPIAWLQAAAFPVTIDPQLSTQPDATAGKDNYIRISPSTANNGTATVLLTGPSGAVGRASLIEFDASSVPSGSTCTAATLSLWSAESNTVSTFSIFSLTSGRSTWGETTSTWDNYDTSAAWTSGGANSSGNDYEADASPPTIVFPVSSTNTEATASLTGGANLTATRIAGWFGGTNTNYGLKIGHEPSNSRSWHSSDGATSTFRPKLVIDYTTTAVANPWHAYAQQ